MWLTTRSAITFTPQRLIAPPPFGARAGALRRRDLYVAVALGAHLAHVGRHLPVGPVVGVEDGGGLGMGRPREE
jgi:hypothetical protein